MKERSQERLNDFRVLYLPVTTEQDASIDKTRRNLTEQSTVSVEQSDSVSFLYYLDIFSVIGQGWLTRKP